MYWVPLTNVDDPLICCDLQFIGNRPNNAVLTALIEPNLPDIAVTFIVSDLHVIPAIPVVFGAQL